MLPTTSIPPPQPEVPKEPARAQPAPERPSLAEREAEVRRRRHALSWRQASVDQGHSPPCPELAREWLEVDRLELEVVRERAAERRARSFSARAAASLGAAFCCGKPA